MKKDSLGISKEILNKKHFSCHRNEAGSILSFNDLYKLIKHCLYFKHMIYNLWMYGVIQGYIQQLLSSWNE